METQELAVRPGEPGPRSLDVLSGLLEGLAPAEQKALECLVAGGTVSAAALAAGVTHSTIHRWLEPGQPLAQAKVLYKQEQALTVRNRLMNLTEKAATNVATAVDAGDARLSMALLSRLGVLAGPPAGPTHQEAVTAHAVAAAQAAIRQEQAAQKPPLKFTEIVPEFTRNFVAPRRQSSGK